MDIILDEIPPEHAAAAQALQSALIELLDQGEGEGDGEGEEGEEGERCEPCDPAQPGASHVPTEAERVATAYFEEVAAAVEWSTEGARLGLLAALCRQLSVFLPHSVMPGPSLSTR